MLAAAAAAMGKAHLGLTTHYPTPSRMAQYSQPSPKKIIRERARKTGPNCYISSINCHRAGVSESQTEYGRVFCWFSPRRLHGQSVLLLALQHGLRRWRE